VAYLAGGDRSLGKERIEVLAGGAAAVIDDFRTVTMYSGGKASRKKLAFQQKGHIEELQAFITALETGSGPPITWKELRSVAMASILAVQSIREGAPFDIA
jgi:hypothetical protein